MAYIVDDETYIRAKKAAEEGGFDPGVLLLGVTLVEELRVLNMHALRSPFNLFKSVSILGELPIDKPEWVGGLVEKIPDLLPEVLEKADRKDLTVAQLAGILARSIQRGYLSDYYGLTQDELPSYYFGQLEMVIS